jgi:WD40 repeat protein
VKDSESSSELSGSMNIPDPKAPPETHSHDAMRLALEKELAANQQAVHIPPPISDHVLLRCVGSGSYGEVWLARSALGTLRAVKIIYRAQFEEAHPYEREFKGILKYEPISRTHEGLVQVLHVGRNDDAGFFYYVMELADAAPEANGESHSDVTGMPASGATELLHPDYSPRTLRSELKHHQRLAPANAAQLTHRLADALVHLHSHGLVHRDIKPGNVIFVNGQPKLADIGLVAGAGDSRSYVGTEGFVPPEGPGSVQGDIYALGKLLYELAAGRDRLEFPQLPDLPPGREGEALLELNEIITRAAAPAAAQRYASAEQLRADLQLFLAGRSLRATRKAERQFVLMKRVALAAAACVLVALGIATLAKQQEQRAEERAKIEASLRARAESAEAESRRQLFTALLEQARATVRSGELGQRAHALDAVRRAAAISNSVELRREAFAALGLPDLRFEREVPTGPQYTFVEIDPKFELVARCAVTGVVEIVSVADLRIVATLPDGKWGMYNGAWSSDGRFLATTRTRPDVDLADLEVWEVGTWRRILAMEIESAAAMSFHPRGDRILIGKNSKAVMIDLASAREISSLPLTYSPTQLSFSPDGNRFAVTYSSSGGQLEVRDTESGTVQLTRRTGRLGNLAWHPNGQWLAIPEVAGSVRMIHSRRDQMRTLGKHKAEAVHTAFSPDGNFLFSGGWEREIICWDARSARRLLTVALDGFNVSFSADGRRCAVTSKNALQIHAFERPLHREFTEEPSGRLRHAAFSPDGQWLAVSADNGGTIWNVKQSGPGAAIREARGSRLFFSASSRELFASPSGGPQDWCRWTIHPATSIGGPPSLEPILMRKPDGFAGLCVASNTLVITSTNGSLVASVESLDLDEENWVNTWPGITGLSPDGRWMALHQPYSPIMQVHRLPRLETVTSIIHPASISSFEFSPNSQELALASRFGTEFWSTANWRRTRFLTNYTKVVFQPGGRALWLVKDTRLTSLHDASSLEPLLPLPPGVLPLTVSPDGEYLAVAVEGPHLQLWSIKQVRNALRELGLDWTD